MRNTEVRKKLLNRRNELLKEIDQRDEDAAAVTSDEEEGKSLERLDDGVLMALSHADREEMVRIDMALAKLADGSYGECEECGAKIGAARLEAMPDALLCIDCATLAEKRP